MPITVDSVDPALSVANVREEDLPRDNGLRPAATPDFSGLPAGVSVNSSSSTSTRRTVLDPLALADFTTQAVALTSNAKQAAEATARALASQQIAEQEQIAGIKQNAIDTAAHTAASSALEESARQRRANILSAGNINPDEIGNQIASAFATINANYAKLEPMGREIDNRAAVGIFDNPLEYLINQTRLPGMVGQYNAIAQQTNRAVETATALQALAGTEQQLSAAMDADQIHKVGVTKAAADASAAQVKLSEAQIANKRAQLLAINQQLLQSEVPYNIARDRVKLTQDSETLRAGMSEGQKRDAELQLVVDRINNYKFMIGGTPDMTPALYRTLPAKQREALNELSGTPYIGKSFSVAIPAIEEFGSIPVMAGSGNSAVTNWVGATKDAAKAAMPTIAISAYTGKGLKAPPDPILFLEALDTVQGKYEKELTDMRTASAGNPAKLDYPFWAKQPMFANNEVAKYVNAFGPASPKPAFKNMDEAVLLDHFVAEVAAGNMPAATAAQQITDFYGAAIKGQIEATKYDLFGMKNTKDYMVQLPETGLLSGMLRGKSNAGMSNLSMLNAPQIESYITKNVARRAVLSSPELQTMSGMGGM